MPMQTALPLAVCLPLPDTRVWDGRKLSLGLRGSVKVWGEFLLMCLVNNMKKTVKRMLDGTVSLPGNYNKLMGETVLRFRGDRRLTSVGAEV